MPAARPTPEQIEEEIAKLETMKPHVRRHSLFNDDNHAAIEAQIRVLRERMGNGQVHDTYGEDNDDEDDFAFDDLPDSNEHTFTNALEASDWMTGASTEPPPSENWSSLVPKGAILTPAPATPRRLISSEEAVQAKCQHKTPCSDCPWARAALNGWLGGASIDEWLRTAHSDTRVDCHTLKGAQCAGLAIYRKNVVKRVEPPLLALPADDAKVFSTPMQFRAHHEAMPNSRKHAANDPTTSRRKA